MINRKRKLYSETALKQRQTDTTECPSHLEACIPPTHELTTYSTLSFSDLDGHNFLLGTKLGFWGDMCRAKMPASRFLVQPDRFSLQELIRESALPCFTTNLSDHIKEIPENRIRIPITDPDANVTYYAVFHQKDNQYKTAFTNLVNNVAFTPKNSPASPSIACYRE